ncbi:uncharacterized protein LOC141700358 [Apium graveolens]|uniref:uncharacterized protein LOC141700358 n=1 Tax=Apium graveolens TaxID=4045 RepID=UPI003D7B7BDD
MDMYSGEAKDKPLTNVNHLSQRPLKLFERKANDIVFRENDAKWVHYPHIDALVIKMKIETVNVHRALVDNGNSTDVLTYDAHKKLGLLDKELTSIGRHLYGFRGNSIGVKGMIRLPLTLGEEPCVATQIVMFIVVDQPCAYNVIVGRTLMRAEPRPGALLMEASQAIMLVLKGIIEEESDEKESPEQVNARLKKRKWTREETTTNIDLPNGITCTVTMTSERLVNPVRAHQPELEETEGLTIMKVGETSEAQVDLDPRMPSVFERVGAADDTIPILADPNDPSKLLKIGSNLSPEKSWLNFRGEIWMSLHVLVKKPNGKWRTCLDFTDLKKVCPKDSFPLPWIDQLVDSTAGHALLSFMDANSGYNQIPMYGTYQEHTSFITDRDLYCYIGMPFGLLNIGATYQRLVNKMFKHQLGNTTEAYVDDMLVKSKEENDHVRRLLDMFQILREYRMKINTQKCMFGASLGSFWALLSTIEALRPTPPRYEPYSR